MKIPTLPPTASLPPMVTFAEGGPCGKGETAAKTGCTPASGDGGGKAAPEEAEGGGWSVSVEDLAHVVDPRHGSTQGFVDSVNGALDDIREKVAESGPPFDQRVRDVLKQSKLGVGLKKVMEEKAAEIKESGQGYPGHPGSMSDDVASMDDGHLQGTLERAIKENPERAQEIGEDIVRQGRGVHVIGRTLEAAGVDSDQIQREMAKQEADERDRKILPKSIEAWKGAGIQKDGSKWHIEDPAGEFLRGNFKTKREAVEFQKRAISDLGDQLDLLTKA